MKKIFAIGLAATVFCFNPAVVFAQESEPATQVSSRDVKSLPDPQWQKIVDDLQAESKTMRDENDKLNSEYNMLQEKLSGLQDSITKLRTEISGQEAENKRLQQKQRERVESDDGVRQNVQKAEKEVAGLEAQNNKLSQDLAELEEKNNLWETKLSGLQVQKRELLLDMKLQEFANEESSGKEDDELKALTRQLVDVQGREAGLRKALAELGTQSQALPPETEKLKAENKVLADQIVGLETQRKQKEIENKKMEEENRRIAAAGPQLPGELVKQQKILENQIAGLETQLESLRQSVAQAKAVLDKKREMMDEIMRLDSENQDLRNRINDLLQQDSPEPDTDSAR
jgi:predicted  nucleic acid-binding Zn-ribbon protein